MTFFQKAKRFFEPVQSKIHIYIEWLCVAFLWWINGVLHIFFLERITYYLTQKPDEFLYILIIYWLAIGVFEILNFSLRKWGWVKIEWYTSNYVSAKYLKLFIELDNNFIESLWTGKLIAIIREWVDRWGLLLWQAIEVCMRLTIALLFGAYIVAQINLYYALILLGVFTIFFLISRFFNTWLFPYRRRRQLNRVDISRSMVKVLMSKNEILQNNSIDEHNQEISALFDKDIQINQDMGTYRTLLVRNSPLGISLILLAIYSLYWPKVLSWNIELNVLVWLTGSMIVIQRIVTDSILSYIDFTKEFIKVETLWEIFDTAPRLAGYHTWSSFTPKKKPIIIKDITYGYNENNVFEHFSLTIEPWKKTALVWESGGGKTTLMKLIAGYLHPDEWYISVLWNRLDETALKTYYPHIGYLTQEPSVFDGTIRENLLSAVSLTRENVPLENTSNRGEWKAGHGLLRTSQWQKPRNTRTQAHQSSVLHTVTLSLISNMVLIPK
jgi:ATP-binding cassette subfamily B protein